MLEAVPNVSEGRDPTVVGEIGAAFTTSATLLDVHSDADHHRSVFTLVANEEGLLDALVSGIRTAVERIDLREHMGVARHADAGYEDALASAAEHSLDLPSVS